MLAGSIIAISDIREIGMESDTYQVAEEEKLILAAISSSFLD